ncbi:MAG: hypothetical protein JO147_10750 [Actinobacteria bacterium]|nr:hypothetical protein [Actinomycetota bacterium]
MSVAWFITAVVLTILLTGWVVFTATRLDRLHARVDAAQAALDAQLVRRVAAVRHAVDSGAGQLSSVARDHYDSVTTAALAAEPGDRQLTENEVGRAADELNAMELPAEVGLELREASVRVVIARRFYNDAVRDTRALRSRRVPRLFHLAGRRELPQFFDIDETAMSPFAPVTPGTAKAQDTTGQEGPA